MGSLIKTGGLFNLEKTIAPIFRKELEYKVQNLKNKKVGGHAESDPSWISPHEVLQSWLIDTVARYFLVENN